MVVGKYFYEENYLKKTLFYSDQYLDYIPILKQFVSDTKYELFKNNKIKILNNKYRNFININQAKITYQNTKMFAQKLLTLIVIRYKTFCFPKSIITYNCSHCNNNF